MGWFSRRKDGASPTSSEGGGDQFTDEPVEQITTRSPGPTELQRIEQGLARATGLGADPDDLSSISAAFDTLRATQDAGAEVSPDDLAAIAMAIGEHLNRHGYRWALVSDTFGTDLGVEARRGSMTTIPHTLVATRWMRGESGWIPGVVGHLVRIVTR